MPNVQCKSRTFLKDLNCFVNQIYPISLITLLIFKERIIPNVHAVGPIAKSLKEMIKDCKWTTQLVVPLVSAAVEVS